MKSFECMEFEKFAKNVSSHSYLGQIVECGFERIQKVWIELDQETMSFFREGR